MKSRPLASNRRHQQLLLHQGLGGANWSGGQRQLPDAKIPQMKAAAAADQVSKTQFGGAQLERSSQ
jgi:hypothetical protein